MTLIYTLTIFTSALLLFLIQPMISKLLLPYLGGSPAVWNTSMMFFQTLLLLGYAYAHVSGKLLGARKQALLHIALLIVAFLWLPVAANTQLNFESALHPISWVVCSLFLSVGVPFFVLAANAPLLQFWLSKTNHPYAANPYFLYSASNIGSLLALFGYPFIIEPLLTLPQQTMLWSVCFVLFGVLIALCAWLLKTHYVNAAPKRTHMEVIDKAPTAGMRIYWLVLAFFPSSLLLGVTTYITTDIASMPLFWVIPLAIYLLTFILAFAKTPLMVDRALNAQIILIPLVVMAIIFRVHFLTEAMILHLFAFFALAMGCHGMLARNKPSTHYLTEYYLWISLGGMLGGVFNSLLAPLLFVEPIEYPLILILCLLVRPALGQWKHPSRERMLDYLIPTAYLIILCILMHIGDSIVEQKIPYLTMPRLAAALYALVALMAYLTYKRPMRFTLTTLALVLALPLVSMMEGAKSVNQLKYVERNFFGVNRVYEMTDVNAMMLMHGTTVHGMQSLQEKDRLQPVSYYEPLQGVFAELPAKTRKLPVAVLGLGAGTLACFGQEKQEFDFFEIDPAVVSIASNPVYFTYLRDCKPSSHIIVGDGRLQIAKMERERYSVIIMDAFTSDAIPMHLLTREALAVYIDKLSEDGIIAFNISNRHLHLVPVLSALAHDAGLEAITKRNYKVTHKLAKPSEWFIMAKNSKLFQKLQKKDASWKPADASGKASLWTDNYSNIFETLF